jgi:hypothetical protein
MKKILENAVNGKRQDAFVAFGTESKKTSGRNQLEVFLIFESKLFYGTKDIDTVG